MDAKVNAVKEIVRFGLDRNIDKMDVKKRDYCKNIIEEMFELYGHDIPKEDRHKLDKVLDAMFAASPIDTSHKGYSTVHEQIDALADVAVFSMTEMLKYGYHPERVLQEVAREINSREGVIVNGKFEKFIDTESKSKWYKADFSHCKLAD